MKNFIYLFLILTLFTNCSSEEAAPQIPVIPDPPATEFKNQFFDDFIYVNADDPEISNFGWDLLNRPDFPGQNAPVPYLKSNVQFLENGNRENDKLLVLSSTTNNTLESRIFSRIQFKNYIFFEGTYAAKIQFDDTPKEFKDGNVETFYAIKNAGGGDPAHSECDFEYLPYDVWGGQNKSTALHMTTWESYNNDPYTPVNASDFIKKSLADNWHLLLFTVFDNEVKYYLDGEFLVSHTFAEQDGTSSVYPDSEMQIAFANWIWSDENSGIGESTQIRNSYMFIDWVYYADDTLMTISEVNEQVNKIRESGLKRNNTID